MHYVEYREKKRFNITKGKYLQCSWRSHLNHRSCYWYLDGRFSEGTDRRLCAGRLDLVAVLLCCCCPLVLILVVRLGGGEHGVTLKLRVASVVILLHDGGRYLILVPWWLLVLLLTLLTDDVMAKLMEILMGLMYWMGSCNNLPVLTMLVLVWHSLWDAGVMW